jgi:hypothetical protein
MGDQFGCFFLSILYHCSLSAVLFSAELCDKSVKLADAKTLLTGLDEWIRRRIRMVTWKRWKRIKTRFENLKKAGIEPEIAWMWANTRKGYWRVANSPRPLCMAGNATT